MRFAISVRISGSFSRSSGVNRPSTKSTSPIFLRMALLAVPRRRRLKSVVLSERIVDLRPLLPPSVPFSR